MQPLAPYIKVKFGLVLFADYLCPKYNFTMKKILLSTFEKTAADNGYEVFTAEEIASYYKEGLQKSMKNELSQAEKDEFTTDIAFLQKAVCIDEAGNEVVRYFRKSQVNFDRAEDGSIMKSLKGTYTDTPENRKLNRVGKPYEPSNELAKSLIDIVKGRYVDNAKNRRLHRVGQEYGGGNGGTDEEGGEKKRGVNRFSTKEKQKIWDSMRTVDDEGAWDSAIEDHFGAEVLEKLSEMDEDTAMKKKFQIALRLPQDTIDSCIEEVGVDPEDESTYPGADKTANRNEKRRARHAAKREAAKQAKAGNAEEGGKGTEKENGSEKDEDMGVPASTKPRDVQAYLKDKSGDDYFKAAAKAYQFLQEKGVKKTIKKMLWESGRGELNQDIRARKYVEAVIDGASHAEAKEFANKAYARFEEDLEEAENRPNANARQLRAETAEKEFNKLKFKKNS